MHIIHAVVLYPKGALAAQRASSACPRGTVRLTFFPPSGRNCVWPLWWTASFSGCVLLVGKLLTSLSHSKPCRDQANPDEGTSGLVAEVPVATRETAGKAPPLLLSSISGNAASPCLTLVYGAVSEGSSALTWPARPTGAWEASAESTSSGSVFPSRMKQGKSTPSQFA